MSISCAGGEGTTTLGEEKKLQLLLSELVATRGVDWVLLSRTKFAGEETAFLPVRWSWIETGRELRVCTGDACCC